MPMYHRVNERRFSFLFRRFVFCWTAIHSLHSSMITVTFYVIMSNLIAMRRARKGYVLFGVALFLLKRSKVFGAPNRVFQKVYIRDRQVLPGNCMLGQLTQRGAVQHQIMGQNFRKNYVDGLAFLPTLFNSTLVKVRSTDLERTLLSAYNFMEGLYPVAANKGGDTEVIEVDTIDDDMDNAWPNPNLCPALVTQWNMAETSPAYQKFYATNVQPLATKYGALWGMNLTNLEMRKLTDIVHARYCHKLPLPPNMTLEDAEALMYATRYLDNLVSSPLETLQFSSGLFLADIYTYLATVDAQKFQMYSAHDDTLRCLLLALVRDVNNYLHWPPYAAHLALELWQDQSGAYVVVAQFDGKVLSMAPPCQGPACRLADFLQLVTKYQFDFDKCFGA